MVARIVHGEMYDVAVVGAGIAGLHAARILEAAEARVIVVEAREEVGGRTRSRRIADQVVDLGGGFFGRRHHRLLGLVREFGLTPVPSGMFDRPVRFRTAQTSYVGRIPRVGLRGAVGAARAAAKGRSLARSLDASQPWRSPRASELDCRSFAEWLRHSGVPDEAFAALAATIGASHTVPIERVSLLAALWRVSRHGGIIAAYRSLDMRLAEGTQQICVRLAERLRGPLLLDTAVSRLDQSDGAVTVNAGPATVCRARRAIVTVPIAALQQIEFAPPLDDRQQALLREVEIGHLTKVVGVPRVPVPAKHRFVVGGSQLAVAVRSGDRYLIGYSIDPSREDQTLIADLAAAFDLDEGDLQAEAFNWSREPFARGAYAAYSPGQLVSHGPTLTRPHGRIEFAGAERGSFHPAYLEGALESAELAAKRVLKG